MKTRFSPAAVGMFVLGAVLLAMVAFISFGGTNFFSKPTRFMVYFDESVSGLDPGASVKVNGVRVGRVAAINVRYDTASRSAQVQTICQIDRNVLIDRDGNTIDLTDTAELQNLIDRGLRAKLNLQGITGLLFVELSFEDPREYPGDVRLRDERYPVVPAVRSPISEVQNSIVEIVADLKNAKIAELSKDLRTMVGTANKRLAEFDVKLLSDRIAGAAAAVENFVDSPEAKHAFVNLNATLTELRGMLARIDGEVGPVSAEFKGTLVRAQQALDTIDGAAAATRRFVQAQGHLGEDASRALHQITEAADAIQRLAEYLERKPNALLLGRQPPQP
ncbi:MAG: MlaD family protein [Candidatus Didemnitutus sp.]|nr:MlaD family protein [Candidatus Didemnitutus sp.]